MNLSDIIWLVWAVLGPVAMILSFAVLELMGYYRLGWRKRLTTLSERVEVAVARHRSVEYGVLTVLGAFWIGMPLLALHWFTGLL